MDPVTLPAAVVSPVVAEAPSILSMVFGSGLVVQAVLIMLIVLSVWSWAITIAKTIQFRKAQSTSGEFAQVFWDSRNFARIDETSRRLIDSPLATVFTSGYRELLLTLQENKDSGRAVSTDVTAELGTVERALRRAELEETHRLERGVTFLATVASAAPFIGLFGTVWGIMNAFHGLSEAKSSTIQAVAPGISEALVATAVGLAAAIPAAIAFNYFSASIRKFRQSMDNFSEEFLNIARRYFVK